MESPLYPISNEQAKANFLQKCLSKKVKTVICSSLFALTVGQNSSVGAVDVINEADIANNSSVEDNTYILDGGTFDVTTSLNMASSATPNLTVDSADTSLRMNNAGGNAVLVTLKDFTINDGMLNVAGGGADGLRAESFEQNGGTLISHGGNVAGSGDGVKITQGGFTQNGGRIIVVGGTAGSGSDGIHIQKGGFTQNDGDLIIQGGTGNNAEGIRIDQGGFKQNGGNISANAGTGQNSMAIHVSNGGFEQNGGTLTAYAGGAVHLLHAVRIDGGNFTQNGGIINTYGGGNNSSGILVLTGSFNQTAGEINAYGGNNSYAHGIDTRSNFNQSGGAIYATGGSFSNAFGIYATGNFYKTNGDIFSVGGTAQGGRGISVANFIQMDGNTTATGGSANVAHGISGNSSFVQEGGTVTANGGTYTNAFGVSTPVFILNNGNLYATGGSNGHGLSYTLGMSMTQNDGNIVAKGGTGSNVYGIGSTTFTQNAGNTTAIGGTGNNAYGIYTTDYMYVNGVLRVERTGDAASIFINDNVSSTSLTFGANSTFTPVVDLSKPDGLASGLVQVAYDKDISIDYNAAFKPEFTNTINFTNGSRQFVFLEKLDGQIVDSFLNLQSSLTLDYSIEKINGDSQYIIKIERLSNPLDWLDGRLDYNAKNLVEALTDGLPTATGDAADALGNIYDGLDNSSNVDEMVDYAHYMARRLTPHSTARLLDLGLNQMDSVQISFNQQLANIAKSKKSQNKPIKEAWFNPISQQGNRSLAKYNASFTPAAESFSGFNLGSAQTFGNSIRGFNVHYLQGNVNGIGYDGQGDTFGISFADRLDIAGDKWLSLTAGYSYQNFDQKRLDGLNSWQSSSPKANMLRLGMTMGRSLTSNSGSTITPQISLDYTYVNFSNFSEDNKNSLGLNVNVKDYNSLKLKMGLETHKMINDRLRFSGGAFVRYELMDRRVQMHSSFIDLNSISFNTRGEAHGRVSGSLGLGLTYKAKNNMVFTLGYDLQMQERYLGHKVSANMSLSF